MAVKAITKKQLSRERNKIHVAQNRPQTAEEQSLTGRGRERRSTKNKHVRCRSNVRRTFLTMGRGREVPRGDPGPLLSVHEVGPGQQLLHSCLDWWQGTCHVGFLPGHSPHHCHLGADPGTGQGRLLPADNVHEASSQFMQLNVVVFKEVLPTVPKHAEPGAPEGLRLWGV